MKVKELIKVLEDFDPDLNIILGKDSEGNDYSPLSDITTGRYLAETTRHGYIELESDMDEDSCSPVDSVVLFPIN